MPKFIILTDLDGSLLDHYNYEFEPALEAINLCHEYAIPIIINTSKTFEEVKGLRKEMHIYHPFVVENGGGVFFSKKEFEANLELEMEFEEEGEFVKFSFGISREIIIDKLVALKRKFHFLNFDSMSLGQVQEYTDLPIDKAKLSRIRHFSEPLIWQDSLDRLEMFYDEVKTAGLRLVKGGRFYHVISDFDKSTCIPFLKKYYENRFKAEIKTICIGDGNNDRLMLEEADHPIVIPAGGGKTLSIENPSAVVAEHKGPTGWNEEVLKIIRS